MNQNQTVDQDLYSRQLYVLGVDAMKKITSTSVLVSGMGGLGVEIAKNIILAGIKNVTIHDTRLVTLEDLASQFYLNQSQIGNNRALSCFEQLSGLNGYVSVSSNTSELTEDLLSQYNCVVLTDYHRLDEILKISHFCHEKGIKFILCDTRGVFGYVFDDFGHSFTVIDPKGERPSRFLISMITQAKDGIVTTSEDEPHNLSDGDRVSFEEVEGMVELNQGDYPVSVVNSRQFTIGDTSKFGAYTCEKRNGYGNQVIVPQTINFDSFEQSLFKVAEKSTLVDQNDFGRDQQVVLIFIAHSYCIQKFEKTNPSVTFEELLEAAKEMNMKYKIVDSINEKLLEKFVHGSNAVLNPTCSVFGGICGQEVLKSVSNKFTPITQFASLGYIESLPSNVDYKPLGDRYDPYRAVFGNVQQEKMMELRYFMLGAGALGCELLKNWALMGVATRGNGLVTVTDMDNIEKSNLNRQFLFRDKDIGQMKSFTAAKAVQVMNEEIKIEAHNNRVGPESAQIYHDKFYMSLSGVCNALDNIPTRIFSDSQCVFYNKPLLESGTLGPKAHYQMVIPNKTESYASMADPPEKDIPQCTLHNFPSNINHCCMWSRDVFSGIFDQIPNSINKFVKEDNFIEILKSSDPGSVLPTLRNLYDFMITFNPKSYKDCAIWARSKFDELFDGRIRQLLSQFPPDAVTDAGLPFWIGNKRAPTPIKFDPNDELHKKFIYSATNIMARIFQINLEGDAVKFAAEANLPEWKPREAIKIDDKKSDSEVSFTDKDAIEIEHLTKSLKNSRQFQRLMAEEFEKDDDRNGHIAFVSATANLRATNYQIQTVTDLEVKRIAGKIIPAIATTTAMICGFVCLEMYKVHCIEEKPLSEFRSGFINLALNLYAISEPFACSSKVCPSNNQKISLWDKWVIEGDLTLKEFITKAKELYNVNVDMITVGSFLLYMSVMEKSKLESRLNRKITQILIDDAKHQPLTENQMFLNITALCVDDDFNDIETPPFILKVK